MLQLDFDHVKKEDMEQLIQNESKRMLAKMKRLYELGEKGRPDVVHPPAQ